MAWHPCIRGITGPAQASKQLCSQSTLHHTSPAITAQPGSPSSGQHSTIRSIHALLIASGLQCTRASLPHQPISPQQRICSTQHHKDNTASSSRQPPPLVGAKQATNTLQMPGSNSNGRLLALPGPAAAQHQQHHITGAHHIREAQHLRNACQCHVGSSTSMHQSRAQHAIQHGCKAPNAVGRMSACHKEAAGPSSHVM